MSKDFRLVAISYVKHMVEVIETSDLKRDDISIIKNEEDRALVVKHIKSILNQGIDSSNKSVVLPCPICGCDPEVSARGSQIDIDCCVSMNRQKVDYMDIDERKTWDITKRRYDVDVESRVFSEVLSEWNRRV